MISISYHDFPGNLPDYQMYAESRKMNDWTVVVSVIIVALTVFSLINRKGKH